MTEYFCPVLELMVFLPGMLLAYLPMKEYLRMRPKKLAAVTVSLTLFLCLLGNAANCYFHIEIIWIYSGHMVLLSVENTYDGKVREKDGVLLSSKRAGEGIGLPGVQHTAEKNGGYCRFHYEEGVFCVNVILLGTK